MGPDGYVIINSSLDTSELGLDTLLSELPSDHYTICPATELALEHVGRALPNAALLGGFAALTGQLEISSVAKAIVDRFGTALGERNVAAAHAAYEYVTAYLKEHNNDVTKVGALQ
jgi:pyruvate ferredoxin oxidoreductase gamma subunit